MARKVNAENIEELAFMLSKFYRLVLSKGNSIITVRDEIELLKAYIEIEKTRFDNLFNVKYELDNEALDYRMIKIVLQPIAENAINHGIAPKGYIGTLIVRLKQDDENLYFSIIDDGVGINRNVLQSIYKSEIAKKRESGYAIQNVRERINAVYEDKGHISIFSRPGIGCSVTITIPKTIDFLNL
jgi:two-component system sensor histidine kinase YesM